MNCVEFFGKGLPGQEEEPKDLNLVQEEEPPPTFRW